MSFTLDEVDRLLRVAIPQDTRPALWITGLIWGLRPGELAGPRWPHVDIDSVEPITVVERVSEVGGRYVGQGSRRRRRRVRSGCIHGSQPRCGGITGRMASTVREHPHLWDRASQLWPTVGAAL